jgi:hypothetical protein
VSLLSFVDSATKETLERTKPEIVTRQRALCRPPNEPQRLIGPVGTISVGTLKGFRPAPDQQKQPSGRLNAKRLPARRRTAGSSPANRIRLRAAFVRLSRSDAQRGARRLLEHALDDARAGQGTRSTACIA